MDNYSLPPTRLDVVAQTMKTSQKVAAECGETNAVVHYDLAVAKLLQFKFRQKNPQYCDDILLCIGAFHVQMTYFVAIRIFLIDSGGPHGRHYNRYTWIHVILSCALQMLHFKRFVSEYCPPPPHSIEQLKLCAMNHPLLLLTICHKLMLR